MSRYNNNQRSHPPVIHSLLAIIASLENRVAFLEKKTYRPDNHRSRSRSRKRYTPRDQVHNTSTHPDMT